MPTPWGIAKLLAESESLGLIARFLERQTDLHDLSDDIHELTNFYTTQRPAWDKLRQAQTRFQPNRDGLEQDPAAAKALARIQEILSTAAPYGLVKEAEALIQIVERVNDALVTQRRDQILPGIDAQLAKIQVELDEAKPGRPAQPVLTPAAAQGQVESQFTSRISPAAQQAITSAMRRSTR